MTEKVIEKLKKLKAHAESAQRIGSEAEAQSFMATLYKLMAEHGVAEADLHEKEEMLASVYFRPEHQGLEIKAKKLAPDWLYVLAHEIGKTCSCAVSLVQGYNWILIRGRAGDVEQCHNALRYLALAAMRLAMRSYRTRCAQLRALGVTNLIQYTKGYKESFLLAFVQRIYQRLADERQKLSATNATGLMILDQKLVKAEQALRDEPGVSVEELPMDKPTNPMGIMDGRSAADEQPLRPAGALQ